MEGKKITFEFEMGGSYLMLGFDDGTAALVKVVNLELTAEEVEEMVSGLNPKKKEKTEKPVLEEKKPKEKSKPEPEPEKEPEEEGYDWDDLIGMKFKALKELCDDNDLDTDPDDFDKDEEDELREAIAKELEIEMPKKSKSKVKEEEPEKEPEEDDSYTWADISKFDYEELKDLCDEENLETDPDDFDEDEEDLLRKAIAKELEIAIPKKKKG